MKIKDLLEMSAQDLRDAEYVIEYLFRELKLDVVWSVHFKERVIGREDNVSKAELIDAFKKMKTKYGDRLVAAKNDHVSFVAVLKDLATDLNIPFAVDFNKKTPTNNKYILRGITIMRKDPQRFIPNQGGGTELMV